jgi:iron complex outermembrane receptor protein
MAPEYVIKPSAAVDAESGSYDLGRPATGRIHQNAKNGIEMSQKQAVPGLWPIVTRIVFTSILAFALTGHALGQQTAEAEDAGLLEEVIVTATKRAENIQDIPVSITALSPDMIDQISAGVPDIRFLSGRVANLTIESSFGRVFPRFYIRGYGNPEFDLNGSQPVSLVVDEIVQENPILKGFPVFDVERIEVLRGPQGTLFGRNTPAGIVKIDSVKPIDTPDGYFKASYGTYNAARIEGAIGSGFGNGWSTRLSVLYMRQDDYVDNAHTGEEDAYEGFKEWAARFQLAYDNGGKFRALFNMHGRDVDGTAILFRANIIKQGTNRLNPDNYDRNKVWLDGQNDQDLSSAGGFLRLEWDIGDLRRPDPDVHYRLRECRSVQPWRHRRWIRRLRPNPCLWPGFHSI